MPAPENPDSFYEQARRSYELELRELESPKQQQKRGWLLGVRERIVDFRNDSPQAFSEAVALTVCSVGAIGVVELMQFAPVVVHSVNDWVSRNLSEDVHMPTWWWP